MGWCRFHVQNVVFVKLSNYVEFFSEVAIRKLVYLLINHLGAYILKTGIKVPIVLTKNEKNY